MTMGSMIRLVSWVSFLCIATWPASVESRSASSLFDVAELTRIVGGVEAQEGRYPYVVSMTKGGLHFCGGSLIAKDVVLTAAHCLGDTIVVRIGSHEIDDGIEILVVDQMEHPDYDGNTNQYDIGLLFLEESTTLDIELLPRVNKGVDFPLAGSITHVLGWGNTREGGYSVAKELMRVDLNVISNEDCEKAELDNDHNYEGAIYEDMMCTDSGEQDACQGDSGGPLIVRDENSPNEDVLVGVVSWGIGCGVMPGVFSRVSFGYDWIRSTVCETSNDPPANLCETRTMEDTISSWSEILSRSPTSEPTTESPSETPSTMPTSTAPTSSHSPTESPTISTNPSASPTISTSPTFQPSISNSPTMSFVPTTAKATPNILQNWLSSLRSDDVNSSFHRIGCSIALKVLLSSVIISMSMWIF